MLEMMVINQSAGFVEGFEEWPDGLTQATPTGWVANNTNFQFAGYTSEASTAFASEGSYSWKFGVDDAYNYVEKDFDLTAYSTILIDIRKEGYIGLSAQLDAISDQGVENLLIDFEAATAGDFSTETLYDLTADISSLTGIFALRILVDSGSAETAFNLYLDNLRLEG